MNKENKNNYNSIIKKMQSRAAYLCKHHYKKYIDRSYNKLMIENLMANGRCHLVAVFKNYLIQDDISDYLRRFYTYEESINRLKKLFKFHQETSVIFPNYTPLIESKYLYNNVIRKQRIIDAQQDLEGKGDKSKSKKKNKKENINTDENIFNSTIFGDILSPSESVLRIMFGIEKKEKKLNKMNLDVPDNIDKIKDNDEYNDNDYDKSEYIEMKNLIKEVESAEENLKNTNQNSLVGYKFNSNNTLKYKLKLISSPNNNEAKNKHYEKVNSITNNSTNITSSSYINNINPIKIQSNQKLKFKDDIIYSQKGKINFNNKNSLTLTISDIKNKDKNFSISGYNNKNIASTTHKKNKSTIPTKTLYGSNFLINNNYLNNLIKCEKRAISKHNSNSHSINTSRLNTNSHNKFILNNNFPFNSKINPLNINNKTTSSVKSNKLLGKVPKMDMKKLQIINKKGNNKIFATTNRSINRNHNYILNNPNLFFGNTELLQSERNIMKKRNQKKELIKNAMTPMINFSPSNSKTKTVFGEKKNNRQIILDNKLNLKSINQYNKNYQNLSIKKSNKTTKKISINENEYNNISKGNFSGRFNKKYINTEF
jgi:hypothetical protein